MAHELVFDVLEGGGALAAERVDAIENARLDGEIGLGVGAPAPGRALRLRGDDVLLSDAPIDRPQHRSLAFPAPNSAHSVLQAPRILLSSRH